MTITERDIMGGLAKGLAVIETFGTDRQGSRSAMWPRPRGWTGRRRGVAF